MEKEKLHRFFAGTTSIQEGMDIRAWMEASEENKRIFYKERKLFDALMVHDDQTTNNCISTKRIPKIIRQWLKIASVIILTLTINYLYQKYKSENEVIAMNTVSVPAGQRTNITFRLDDWFGHSDSSLLSSRFILQATLYSRTA